MSTIHNLDVDDLFINTNKLFGDEKIKQLLRGDKTVGKNPNPDIYQECRVTFVPFQKSVLKAVLSNLTQFEFDNEEGNANKSDIIGPFYVPEEKSLYIGQFKGDIREGKGIQIFEDGCYYEGYFKNDSTNLEGRLIFGDGDMYLGELIDNSMNGKGVYYKKDGSKYTGTFVDDAPQGQGREEWEDGA
jgi:hypothetical protein